MGSGRDRGGRTRARPPRLLDVVAGVLVLTGVAGLAFHFAQSPAVPPVDESGVVLAPARSMMPPALSSPAPRTAPSTVLSRSAPVRLSIRAIGVDTPLVRLALNRDGTLEVPADFAVAGWYALGPSPGQRGSAVIVGHVDSFRGPAVFYRLGLLSPGNVVHIALADGAQAAFRVYAVREYPKTAFPTSLVYGPTSAPELRLVTCGGRFDARTGHYLDNIVVFARARPTESSPEAS